MRRNAKRLTALPVVLGAAFALLWPVLARAQGDTKAEARKHFDRAVELMDEESYAEAVIEFERAYDLSPHPLVLFNLGEAYVALGKPVEAVDALTRWLAAPGTTLTAQRRRQAEQDIVRQKGRIAYVIVRVRPDGASVRVDGKDIGKSPLADAVRVGIGTHVVEASLAAHQPARRELSVAGEEQAALDIVLEALPREALGQVALRCPVTDANVLVDDRVVGRTPVAAPLLLEPGPHRIAFQRQGYAPAAHSLDVRAGTSQDVPCKLTPLSPLPPSLAGTLDVRPSETGARVLVDGAALPASGLLPIGRHAVQVRRAGFRPWQGEVQLAPGVAHTIEARLVPTSGYVADNRAAAGTQRVWAWILGGAGVAAGAVTAGVFLWNDGRHDDWKAERAAIDAEWAKPAPAANTQTRQDANDTLAHSIQRADNVTVGLGVAAGALIVAGVVVFVTGGNSGRYDDLTASVGSDGATLGWRQSW